MKSYNTLYILAFLLIVLTNPLLAQRAEQPDLQFDTGAKINDMTLTQGGTLVVATNDGLVGIKPSSEKLVFNFTRSEERRVGKECRSRWSPYDKIKKINKQKREW